MGSISAIIMAITGIAESASPALCAGRRGLSLKLLKTSFDKR